MALLRWARKLQSLPRALVLTNIAIIALSGCSRAHYRQAADRDAYGILDESGNGTAWSVPREFGIEPDPRSRLFDSTPLDDPLLPPPRPRLHTYDLPDGSGSRSPAQIGDGDTLRAQSLRERQSAGIELSRAIELLNVHQPEQSTTGVCVTISAHEKRVFLAGHAGEPSPLEGNRAAFEDRPTQEQPERRSDVTIIPQLIWEALPIACMRRMFEFAGVRDEYERSYHTEPPAGYRDSARRLTLDDLIQLTLLNSREYQTQKELLYSAALRLSLERFAFDLKSSSLGGRLGPSGNGTAVDFAHRHSDDSSSTLRVPSSVQGEKILATGGDFLARLANDVVFTFSGPDGFAADVSTELFLNISQTVFQRDIRFEQLTQAERDVVYAARDFTRFRKTLFFQIVVQYYNLLQTYRQIEIDSQNYFALVRAFNQRAVETRTGMAPRVQLDQVEQDALRGRSGLIATCNRLERDLDNLKILMGLPPELLINMDLTELEELTLRDELAVANELIARARRQLQAIHEAQDSQIDEILHAAAALVERMIDAEIIRMRLGRGVLDMTLIKEMQLRLRTAQAAFAVDRARESMRKDRAAMPPHPAIRILERTLYLHDTITALIEEKIALARHRSADPRAAEQLQQETVRLRRAVVQMRAEVRAALAELQLQRLPDMVQRADMFVQEAEALDRAATTQARMTPESPAELERRVRQEVQQIFSDSQRHLDPGAGGLVPVEIDTDDAMLTALLMRLDLMNQRGEVADRWRAIKLRADELRSVINFNFSQSVGHRASNNTSADDSFVDSETRLTASLDTPFNRKAQRNNFRQALINYQAALRNLTLLEDNIKVSVRNDLRDLAVAIEQFQIDIASAALARERVGSTQLQLALGVANVTARDFLEAQDAYSQSLSRVAARHIGYILLRTQLFLNLELLNLDENGLWRELYDERYQPIPASDFSVEALPSYGTLPSGVHHSADIRRMLDAWPE